MRRSAAVAAVGMIAGIFGIAGCLAYVKYTGLRRNGAEAHAYEPAEAVQVVQAREVQWRPTSDLVGTVISRRSILVSNELAGTVEEVRFESGSIVEAGQVLLTFDDSTDRADLEAALASVRVAEAGVTVADARIRLAETEVRHTELAAEARAATAIEMERAQSELDATRADRVRLLAEVDQARARVAQVQARLDKLIIRAPFRARAGLRSVHEGQYLAEGAGVVMLEEVADQIYLDFAIPQEYAARVRPGTAVMATGEVFGDEPVRIEVVAVDATVNNDTRNVRVRAVVDNRDDTLRPGMFVRIRVPVEEPKTYVVVPTTAVRRASYADQVFVVVPGDAPNTLRAAQRFVKLGPAVGDDAIVLEGVSAGESVAATGSFKLRDGALVTRVEPDQAGVAAAGRAPPG